MVPDFFFGTEEVQIKVLIPENMGKMQEFRLRPVITSRAFLNYKMLRKVKRIPSSH